MNEFIKQRWIKHALPGHEEISLPGKLLVIEGSDGVGRSTQVRRLKRWLENTGHPVKESGFKRSELLGETLTQVMQRTMVGPRTLALFYATDFIEQLEKIIIPSLTAGFLVIADRYLYSLLARSTVRGVDGEWLKQVHGMAIQPDLIIYLDCPPPLLAERTLLKRSELDYWESGLDLGRRGGLYESFVEYQSRIRNVFHHYSEEFGMHNIDGARPPDIVAADIQAVVTTILTPTDSAAV